MKRPNSCVNLKKAIERLPAAGQDAVRLGRALANQIAQKLHAVSSPGSIRAHDLVDLQLVLSRSRVDLAETAAVCRRLFSYRRRQAWPPRIVKGDGWDALYQRAIGDLGTRDGILPTADEAVAWANDLIARIDTAP